MDYGELNSELEIEKLKSQFKWLNSISISICSDFNSVFQICEFNSISIHTIIVKLRSQFDYTFKMLDYTSEIIVI